MYSNPSLPSAVPGPGQSGQLGRAVAVVDVVAELRLATAAEIGRRLGLAKSTVHRLLGVLQVHGLVVRAADGFRLGERAHCWVDWEQAALVARLRQLALPYLVELRGQVGTAVAVGVRAHDAVAYPERLYDLSQLPLLSPLRPLSPAHATAAGKVLLAFAPAADRDRDPVAAPELARYTSATITCPRVLAEELARVRATGLATARGELTVGLTALAAPIADHRRRVVAAIAIAGPADRVLGPARSRAVRAAAAAVSMALRSAGTK